MGAANVPYRSAVAGAAEAADLTIKMPTTEESKPTEANASGKNIKPDCDSMAIVEAIAIQAIIEPQ